MVSFWDNPLLNDRLGLLLDNLLYYKGQFGYGCMYLPVVFSTFWSVSLSILTSCYFWPLSELWCLLAHLVAAGRFVTAAEPLQKVQTEKQISCEKWTGSERLEAHLELWCCYFHTSSSPALSTRLSSSSDWTASVTVSGWNRLRCCFYYILHPPLRCLTPWLRALLVIYLLWTFLI